VITNAKEGQIGDENDERVIFCRMVDMLSLLIDLSDKDLVARVKCVMVQNFILETILDAMEKIEVSAAKKHGADFVIAFSFRLAC
jgi:hypothetical protein